MSVFSPQIEAAVQVQRESGLPTIMKLRQVREPGLLRKVRMSLPMWFLCSARQA